MTAIHRGNLLPRQFFLQKSHVIVHFSKKWNFFSVGYLALDVSLSTKCKQIIFSNNFFKTEKMSNELLLPQHFTDLVIYFV